MPHNHPSTELEREFELERMVLFSDAVFAIAIHTLICRYIFGGNGSITVRGKEDEKLYLYVQAKYVAAGIGLTVIAMILVAILLPGNSGYLSLAMLLLPVFVAITGKRAGKYKPISTELQTKRTTLTLLHEDDLPAMTAMAQEPETFRYVKKLRVMTDTQYQEFLRLKLEQIRLKTGYHWAVWLRRDGRFVGAVNLNPIGDSKRLQIGCQLKREFWGQGLATELTARVLKFAIKEAGLKEVYGVFEKENIVSRRLLDRLGFAWVEDLTEHGVEAEIHRYAVPD
jgi:ribosomal-protein-alanine N-acetyltransferase